MTEGSVRYLSRVKVRQLSLYIASASARDLAPNYDLLRLLFWTSFQSGEKIKESTRLHIVQKSHPSSYREEAAWPMDSGECLSDRALRSIRGGHRRDLINCLRMLQRFDIQVVASSRVVAAHNNEVDRFSGVEVDFLMGNLRSKVNKIAGADFRLELEAFAPPDLAPAFAYIDCHFVRAVIMRARSPIRLQGYGSNPSLRAAGTCKIKYCGSALS